MEGVEELTDPEEGAASAHPEPAGDPELDDSTENDDPGDDESSDDQPLAQAPPPKVREKVRISVRPAQARRKKNFAQYLGRRTHGAAKAGPQDARVAPEDNQERSAGSGAGAEAEAGVGANVAPAASGAASGAAASAVLPSPHAGKPGTPGRAEQPNQSGIAGRQDLAAASAAGAPQPQGSAHSPDRRGAIYSPDASRAPGIPSTPNARGGLELLDAPEVQLIPQQAPRNAYCATPPLHSLSPDRDGRSAHVAVAPGVSMSYSRGAATDAAGGLGELAAASDAARIEAEQVEAAAATLIPATAPGITLCSTTHLGTCLSSQALYQMYLDNGSSEAMSILGKLDIPVYYGVYSEFKGMSELVCSQGTILAGRYKLCETLFTEAAFSVAVKAQDMVTGEYVCLKIINNDKDTLDQCMNEIRLLLYINRHDPTGKHFVQLRDYFYTGHRLILVFELLGKNLYSYYSKVLEAMEKEEKATGKVLRRNPRSPLAGVFTMPRLQHISRQILESISFLHRLSLLHVDLKHENILLSGPEENFDIRLIDIGSSAFLFDDISTYVQSRSYRAPEVILGLPYDGRADVWSLGPILLELLTGRVAFPIPMVEPSRGAKPYASLLARIVGLLGPIPRDMILAGRDSHKYFTRNLMLYETNYSVMENRDEEMLKYEILRGEEFVYVIPKRTSIAHWLGWVSRPEDADREFLDFVSSLMEIDPRKRPTAAQALEHPWLRKKY